MKIIKIANTLVHIHNGPIGISCSGGADSALLLYILMQNNVQPIHIFTCTSKLKNYGSALTSVNVINKCIELTNNNKIFHHIHYVDEQTEENLFYENQFRDINVLYTAITENPPEEVTDRFMNRISEVERNPEKLKPLYRVDNKVYTPFANINKKEIYNIYKELNLIDSLYPITRSCESFTRTQGHCGQCWWCEERMWAFERLE
jgi:7-cyano-7-deazaguanine synthase in queuosine biosynthesis